MARLTISLPDEVAAQLRQDARRAKVSVSTFVAELVRRRGAPDFMASVNEGLADERSERVRSDAAVRRRMNA